MDHKSRGTTGHPADRARNNRSKNAGLIAGHGYSVGN
jgi:hypothetical protein